MGTKIKCWQILEGKLTPIDTTLRNEGRNEPYDLEPWIASNPEIISDSIMIIGRQVETQSGRIDLLGMDKFGNTVIIEIKRDELPRESLAQAIDYASDVAEWTVERLSEVCTAYTQQPLEEAFTNAFEDVDLQSVTLNSAQRIVLVGFSIEGSLERMINWLSDSYGVTINAIILNYLKTKGGEELLAKSSIISEERIGKRMLKWEMSDDPGNYDVQTLKQELLKYLSRDMVTNRRIREILLPSLLETEVLTRDQLKKSFVDFEPTCDESKVGFYLTAVSRQLGMAKNDFLRQVVAYEYPDRWHPDRKDKFSIRAEYRDLVKEVLEELNKTGSD